ncbi:hypothetical protein CBR_g148 [Chara braunii]|uniref:Uncharacterized protein n=1 Tax=Chara braunii TaxID=69332 RepID=A0A388JLS0_CHABU|nr:hypothetical protein CBR_g148 [Chara braunii]|eukprot:GBG58748.1 hypothetical protein CBR_g148 [Chara braunii]
MGDVGEGFSRGRVKVESLNAASYVAKSITIFAWLIDKRSAEVELGGTTYKLEFKPWLTNAQLRDQRRIEELLTFWIIVVQVPLDAMFYLEAHIRRAIGPVLRAHPPKQDRMRPALVNIKFDLDPQARQNMKDSITVDTFEGDELVVKLASSDTPRCRRCRTFFHSTDECRRTGRSRQQQGGSGGQERRAESAQEASSRPVYQGPLGSGGGNAHPVPTQLEAEGGRNQAPGAPFQNVYQNPTYMVPSQPVLPNGILAQLLQEMALAQSNGQLPLGQPLGLFSWMMGPGNGGGFQPYQPQNTLQPTCLFPAGVGGLQQGGGGAATSSQVPGPSGRPDMTTPGGRTPGNTSGKHRRVDSNGLEIEREDSRTSIRSSEGSGIQETVIGTPENRILSIMCIAAKETFSVIAWSGGDGVPELFSTTSPEQPMPTAVSNIVQAAVRGKFIVRLVPDVLMGRFIHDLTNGKKLKLFVPIFDTRMETEQLAKLEQEGMRLLPLNWFAEGKRPDLRRIRVPPLHTGEFLADLNSKLARDRKINSKFFKDFLQSTWVTPPSTSGTAAPTQHTNGRLSMNG